MRQKGILGNRLIGWVIVVAAAVAFFVLSVGSAPAAGCGRARRRKKFTIKR